VTVAEQLTEIYEDEPWHNPRMDYQNALKYHTEQYDKGNIHVYEENGEILGYYERYIIGDTCFLHNVYVKKEHRRGKVFRELYKHFFQTLPLNIKKIVGEKQKVGKMQEVRIRR
jgi:hypothetical protein